MAVKKKKEEKEIKEANSNNEDKYDLCGTFEKATQNIVNLIRSRVPIIYIESNESERTVLKILSDVCEKGTHKNKWTKELYVWDVVQGMTQKKITKSGYETFKIADVEDPGAAIDYIETQHEKVDCCYILCEFHHYLETPNIQRRLRNFAEDTAVNYRKTIILLSPKNAGMSSNGKRIPPELENIVHICDWPLPDGEVLDSHLTNHLVPTINKTLKARKYDEINMDSERKQKLIDSLKGMTLAEGEAAIYSSAIQTYGLDPSVITLAKKQIVKKNGLVEYIEPTGDILDDIGGAKHLKTWLRNRRPILSEDAHAFGCDLPNGVMLIGPWGSGKSSTAKAVIDEFGLPGLRIDAAKLMESFVGSSERNTAGALKLAESIAPCVTGRMRVTLGDGSEETMNDLWEKADPSSEIEKDGLKVRNLNIQNISLGKNFKQVRVPSKKITRRKSKDIFSVKTPTAKIEITGNHLWPILGVDGSVNWIRTDNLEKGMQCIVPSHITPDQNPSIFSKSHIPQEAIFKDGRWLIPSNNPNKIEVKIPEELNDEILYLCGLMEADGYFGKSNNIGLVNSTTRLHEVFVELMTRQFGIKKIYFSMFGKTNKQQHEFLGTDEESEFEPSFKISLYSSLLSKFFQSISDNILKMTPRLVSAWLSGYLDGDGSVSRNTKYPKIYWADKSSREQKEKIRSALLRLGIIATGHTWDRVEVTSRRKVYSLY